MTFAANLKALMKRESLTQAELSKRTGIPATSLYRLMSGETTNPTLDTLHILAKHFGCGISELVGDRPIAGISEDYSGEFSVPFPKLGETAKIIRLISAADQEGRIDRELAASVYGLLQTVLRKPE